MDIVSTLQVTTDKERKIHSYFISHSSTIKSHSITFFSNTNQQLNIEILNRGERSETPVVLPWFIINNSLILVRIVGGDRKTIISSGDNLRFTFNDFDQFEMVFSFFVVFCYGEFGHILNVRIVEIFDGPVSSDYGVAFTAGRNGGDRDEERESEEDAAGGHFCLDLRRMEIEKKSR